MVHRGSRARNAVALTFDDGPHHVNSPRLLEVLRRHGVRATFFVNGNAVKGHESIVGDALEAGCEIGNHFYQHVSVAQLNYVAMEREIEGCWNSVRNIRPEKVLPKIVRPPYGIVDSKILFWAWRHGWAIVLWSKDSLDSHNLDRDRSMRHIRELSIENGDIILMHEDALHLEERLELSIQRTKAKGLEFVTVSEMLGLRNRLTADPFCRSDSR